MPKFVKNQDNIVACSELLTLKAVVRPSIPTPYVPKLENFMYLFVC